MVKSKIVLLNICIVSTLMNGCGQPNSKSIKASATRSDIIKIPVGKAPGCVETADLNHDGYQDLIVTSEADGGVTILLGESNMKFQEPKGSPFSAGHAVNDVTIGDFNNDGNPDLAFANHDKKYLTVLLGNGRGNFNAAPGSPFPVEVIPHTHGIASGDFNRDGRLDLVTDSWANDQVEVLFADSIKGFKTPGVFFKVGKHPYQRIRAADINNDGNTDIVTTNLDGNNATILLGTGKGDFYEASGSPFPCGEAPFGVAIGDVNADGKPDLAIINSPASTSDRTGKNGLTVLFGDGTGKFSTMEGCPFEAGKIPNRVAIGDINGDGVNDIVTSDNDDNKIYLFLMNRNSKLLSSKSITAGNHPKGLAIADFDGDGKGDIAVCNNLDDNILILYSK